MYYSLLLIFIFLAGIYYYAYYHHPELIEGFTSSTSKGETRCPNILIQKGTQFFLYNSKIAKVPGVNPIQFENLEEYVEFTDWQRSQGIRCPVLFLQHSYDAQGNPVYKVRPSPTDPQGGLPPYSSAPSPTLLTDSGRNDPPYNINSLPGFDPMGQNNGENTPLDQMNQAEENLLFSPNPMDDNWGGQQYTQSLVDQGVYAGNEVSIRV
jgi:hypothetical protein